MDSGSAFDRQRMIGLVSDSYTPQRVLQIIEFNQTVLAFALSFCVLGSLLVSFLSFYGK